MDVECTDVPAPGVGANCGPCPDGFNGDGVKCLGINFNIKLYNEEYSCYINQCMIF